MTKRLVRENLSLPTPAYRQVGSDRINLAFFDGIATPGRPAFAEAASRRQAKRLSRNISPTEGTSACRHAPSGRSQRQIEITTQFLLKGGKGGLR